MAWKVKFEKRAEKKFGSLDKQTQKRIRNFLKEKLMADPAKYSTLLIGNKQNILRARVGDYRIIFQLRSKEFIIILIDIGHRREVYK